MNYAILLAILPLDIVHYIQEIIKIDHYQKVIFEHCLNLKEKYNSVYKVANIITNNGNITNVVDNNLIYKEILQNEFLYSLETIYKASYNRAKYINAFWQSFTDLLSKKLMQYYNNIILNHENRKNNNTYIILNKCIKMWFKICVKHNIRIALLFSRNSNEYVKNYSKNMKEIKNFSKFLYAPRTIDADNFYISENFSSDIITTIVNL